MIFLRKYWQLALIVWLAGILMLACRQRDQALRAEGAAKEKLAVLTTKLRTDSLRARAADSVVQVDTLRLVRWATRFDTVRRTLRITDTVEVQRFVTVADSTIRACRQAVTSLSLSCAAKDTVIATQRAMLAVRPATVRALRWQDRVLWTALGVGIGVVADRAIQH